MERETLRENIASCEVFGAEDFLKHAFSSGAHLKLPDGYVKYLEGEKRWLVAGAVTLRYYFDHVEPDGLIKQYGLIASGNRDPKIYIHKMIRTFIKHLWENSPAAIKERFPLERIVVTDSRLRQGARSGSDQLRRREIAHRNRELAVLCEAPPDDYEGRQKLLDRVTPSLLHNPKYNGLFISASSFFEQIGLGRLSGQKLREAIEYCRERKIVAISKVSYKRILNGKEVEENFYITFTSEVERFNRRFGKGC